MTHDVQMVYVFMTSDTHRPGPEPARPMTYATRGSRSRGDVWSGPQAPDQRHGAYATVMPRAAPAAVRAGYRCGHSRKTLATQLGLPLALASMAVRRQEVRA